MCALPVKSVTVLDLVAVIVRVSYDDPACTVQSLDIAVVISYLEGHLTSVGENSPFKRSRFLVASNYLLYLRYHVILMEAIAQCLCGILVKLGEISHKGKFSFAFIEQCYIHRLIGYRKKHARL